MSGVAIAARWDELAAIAEQRIDDGALVFARLHYLMCLLRANRRQSVAVLYGSLLHDARRGRGTQARLAADVGVAMADAQIAEATQRPAPGPGSGVPDLRQRLAGLGGSHVQRDIFHLILDARAARPRPASLAADYETGLAGAASCTLTAP
jgi:hypothetical protein